MNVADSQAQLEQELTWRMNEMRFFRNLLLAIEDETARKVFRKALVVMLYSHFEGFCKAALTVYVRAVNQEGLECGQLNDCLAAASLAEVFEDLNSGRQSELFRRTLPSEDKLHRMARQVDFIASLPTVMARRPAVIPEELVDAESNLKPIVLKKNLYRLGFQYDMFASHDGTINHLLQRRNDVAHGARLEGLESQDFETLEQAVVAIMADIKTTIYESLDGGYYLRAS